MAVNVKIQVYRGLHATLATLPSTGAAGVLAWTTDTNQLYVDTGSGSGIGTAWMPLSGVVGVAGPTSHQFVTYIDTSGVQHTAQPAFTDISGSLSQTQLPATIGAGSSLTDIDCGTF